MRSELNSQLRAVIHSLDDIADLLENLGDPLARLFRKWSADLRRGFSKSAIEEIWSAIQPMRSRMGYLDYADPEFNSKFDALFYNIEVLASLVRRMKIEQ
jgi:hypothetical protein